MELFNHDGGNYIASLAVKVSYLEEKVKKNDSVIDTMELLRFYDLIRSDISEIEDEAKKLETKIKKRGE